jgi:hypothetical protein
MPGIFLVFPGIFLAFITAALPRLIERYFKPGGRQINAALRAKNGIADQRHSGLPRYVALGLVR